MHYNADSCDYKEVNLVEQVLEQGQNLRKAMVQSILNHNPFYPLQNIHDDVEEEKELSTAQKHKFIQYMKGDPMSLNDEKEVLETFRSMSNTDICEVTEKSYSTLQNSCNCDTCRKYSRLDFKELEPVVPKLNLNVVNLSSLKYVDTMRVSVHSLKLNKQGKLKVGKLPNTAYFIEYDIPPCLLKSVKKKSKVETGLELSNSVKLCSRKLNKEAIYFKQISMHDIVNVDSIDLESVQIPFRASCRSSKQKSINVIGHAKFNMASFLSTNYLTCNQELVIFLENCTVIAVGSIKICFQLGCGRIYFGKAFFDSINANKENNILPEIDLSIDKERPAQISPKRKNKVSRKVNETKNQPTKSVNAKSNIETNQILFGFIFVSEVEYLKDTVGTYFSCHPFCQKDSIYSHVINGNGKLLFNFYQTIPIIYNEDFISKLRDNYMVFEFWEKKLKRNNLIGISSIPLHQYYLAFRNSTIVEYLFRNKLPVIGTDWYETITDPQTGVVTGQVKILVALGSHEQIQNLECERGFKDDIVTKTKRTFLKQLHEKPIEIEKITRITPKSTLHKPKFLDKSEQTITVDKSEKAIIADKQINTKTIWNANDAKLNKPPNARIKTDKSEQTSFIQKADKASQSEAMELSESNVITSLLQQFAVQHPITADTSTNTEENLNVGRTIDLLDTLQKAFKVDDDIFKAHIVVDSALHLPSRKKCKARRVNGKLVREEMLPCTYVTFENGQGEVKSTHVIQNNKNPKWDYRCDTNLDVDLLTNSQKRLIFKVWKVPNTASMQPNLQNDSVLGFTALDLTVLSAGLPLVQGWFNIVDFSGKCNGQIKINVTPLQNISKHNIVSNNTESLPTDIAEEPCETLNRALKRKFTELDEITQRLRSRLSNVTNDESDTSNDEIADEFENDINTLCVEDDYNTVDFVREAQDLNLEMVSGSLLKWQKDNERQPNYETCLSQNDSYFNCLLQVDSGDSTQETPNPSTVSLNATSSDSVTTLDKQLIEGKQRIDTLLQKLSLISSSESTEPFANRHVSGCCNANDITQTAEDEILHELGINDRFDASKLIDASVLKQISIHKEMSQDSIDESKSKSEDSLSSSSKTQLHRDAPDGEGNNSDDK